ncbi:MAG: hypothetical protein JNK99_03550 [Candidatus Accumulibacter sp.]|jgi:hypothetical protein|uniref:hypothetical protein n=1 Tax=Accumulibacter sp. TaxID=2053492 RepID=UPI001A591635|nr:hypothetical protein [Accumulibacter sp.]MBL8393814.1 hypothetical protein [Accumulibacter sp.]
MTAKPTSPPVRKPTTAAPGPVAPPRAPATDNVLRQAPARWQRSARYVWDKGGSRGGR